MRDLNRDRKADSTDIATSNMGRHRYTIRVGYAIITSDGIFGAHRSPLLKMFVRRACQTVPGDPARAWVPRTGMKR